MRSWTYLFCCRQYKCKRYFFCYQILMNVWPSHLVIKFVTILLEAISAYVRTTSCSPPTTPTVNVSTGNWMFPLRDLLWEDFPENISPKFFSTESKLVLFIFALIFIVILTVVLLWFLLKVPIHNDNNDICWFDLRPFEYTLLTQISSSL